MTPVIQTKVVVKKSNGEMVIHGNCYAAAIASMLDLPISEVPNVEVFFHIEDNSYWAEVMHTWLTSKGYELCTDDRYKVFHPEHEPWWPPNADEVRESLRDSYYLVSGPSPRGVYHICIYQNGKMVHDPHPTGEGILEAKIFETIEKIATPTINPSQEK